eukprot:gene20247-26286_t
MISVNDDDDPHFRKAFFDPNKCPSNCTRPCEKICPAQAIPSISKKFDTGVIADRCYGCGRCFAVCPYGLIEGQSYQVSSDHICDIIKSGLISAIEIHTLNNHQSNFKVLWDKISNDLLFNLNVLAVSFPDMQNYTTSYIESLQNIISNGENFRKFNGIQIWQTDGRPMSGDIGKGATYPTCELAIKILDNISNDSVISFDNNKHFVQLAGGANSYSGPLARSMGLSNRKGFGGYGFGGYARRNISIYLQQLEDQYPGAKIEDHIDIYNKCLDFAQNLVDSVRQ